MKKSRGGFTLIEILVVIAIFALLAAVLFPVFAHVREKGRQSACVSNLHQLGIALSAYTIDYDEQFPTSKIAIADTINIAWAGQLYSHVQNIGVFRCPTDDTASTGFPVVSYGLNLNLAAASSLAALAAPARTVLLFEVSGDTAQIADHAEGQTNGSNPPQYSASGNGLNGGLANLTGLGPLKVDSAQYATGVMDNSQAVTLLPPDLDQYQNPGRHSGNADVLLADGHVKWTAASQVSAGGNAVSAANEQSRSGCQYRGLGTGTFPCAEGTGSSKHALTFSAQ